MSLFTILGKAGSKIGSALSKIFSKSGSKVITTGAVTTGVIAGSSTVSDVVDKLTTYTDENGNTYTGFDALMKNIMSVDTSTVRNVLIGAGVVCGGIWLISSLINRKKNKGGKTIVIS